MRATSGEGEVPTGANWYTLTRLLRSGAADLLHTAFPSDCRVCNAPMLGLRAVRVCESCVEQVEEQAKTQGELCSRCGDAQGMESVRFAASMGVSECTPCQTEPPAYARAVAFGPYDNEMRELVHALKFDGMRRIAEHVMGKWLADAVLKLHGEAASELLVVPVPLHRERERERGFNQSELLARAALRRLRKARPGWKLELRLDILRRVRETRPQFALGAAQRRTNLKGAFRVKKSELVRGREILLIDDLLTSGATAAACARTLLRAGATKVWVATVSRAQPESLAAMESTVARWDAMMPEQRIPAG